MGRQMLKNGGNTFAFFTRNPRGGKAKEIDPADVERFLELSRENHFGKLVAHAPYTMNACAAKEDVYKRQGCGAADTGVQQSIVPPCDPCQHGNRIPDTMDIF